MGRPYRIGLVGAGSMGSLHARVIAQSERAELVTVVDPRRSVGRDTAERYAASWVPDIDGLTGVDGVVVASATETHPGVGTELLRRGLPLLVEKPLADRLEDAENLVRCSADAGVPLMCGLLERYNPAILTVMRLVTAPVHVSSVRHSPYVARIRTGVASDLLIHDIDTVLRLSGTEPSCVRGVLGYLHPDSEPTSEDVATALLTFPDGMVASLSASRLDQRKVRSCTIAELDRLIEVDMLRNTVTIYRHVGNEASPDGLSYKQQTIIEIPALVSSREPLAAQLDRFIDLLSGSADPDEERDTILPAHRVVMQVGAAAGAA